MSGGGARSSTRHPQLQMNDPLPARESSPPCSQEPPGLGVSAFRDTSPLQADPGGRILNGLIASSRNGIRARRRPGLGRVGVAVGPSGAGLPHGVKEASMKLLSRITLSLAAVLTMMLAGCASGSGGSVFVADQQQRRLALATSDHLIVPGRRIGPIRLGMGMDEVVITLGKPDYDNPGEGGASWVYSSLNMTILFSGGAAPSVTSVLTMVNHQHSKSFGDILWGVDQDPIYTVFQTSKGIGLGATSLDVRRAYSYSTYEGSEVNMHYRELGIHFIATTDHRIWIIRVNSPR